MVGHNSAVISMANDAHQKLEWSALGVATIAFAGVPAFASGAEIFTEEGLAAAVAQAAGVFVHQFAVGAITGQAIAIGAQTIGTLAHKDISKITWAGDAIQLGAFAVAAGFEVVRTGGPDPIIPPADDAIVPSRAINVVATPADEVNASVLANNPNYTAPFTPGTVVSEFVTGEQMQLVRVSTRANVEGGWLARAKDIEGLNAEQIAQKLNLTYTPTVVSDVNVPAGTRLQVGEINPQVGGPNTHTLQYRLLSDIPNSSYTNTRSLP